MIIKTRTGTSRVRCAGPQRFPHLTATAHRDGHDNRMSTVRTRLSRVKLLWNTKQNAVLMQYGDRQPGLSRVQPEKSAYRRTRNRDARRQLIARARNPSNRISRGFADANRADRRACASWPCVRHQADQRFGRRSTSSREVICRPGRREGPSSTERFRQTNFLRCIAPSRRPTVGPCGDRGERIGAKWSTRRARREMSDREIASIRTGKWHGVPTLQPISRTLTGARKRHASSRPWGAEIPPAPSRPLARGVLSQGRPCA